MRMEEFISFRVGHPTGILKIRIDPTKLTFATKPPLCEAQLASTDKAVVQSVEKGRQNDDRDPICRILEEGGKNRNPIHVGKIEA